MDVFEEAFTGVLFPGSLTRKLHLQLLSIGFVISNVQGKAESGLPDSIHPVFLCGQRKLFWQLMQLWGLHGTD